MHRARKSSAGYQAGNEVGHTARRTGWAAIAAGSIAVLFTAGCGQNYRPVVSAIGPVGPAGQPTKFAIAVSNPGDNLPGLVTAVDFSGDTVLATPSIQRNPTYLALSGPTTGATVGYTINADGDLDTFGVANPLGLITANVGQTTLVADSNPVSITPIVSTASGAAIFIPQAGSGSVAPSVAALSSTGPSLLQNLTVNTAPAAVPIYVVAANGAPRIYALSSDASGAGIAAAIETTQPNNPAVTNLIPVGSNPVYGVMSADALRAYIVNKGSGTLSVINVVTNAPDATTPTIPAQPAIPPPDPSLLPRLGVNSVWAVLVPTRAEVLVLNAGDGTTPGTLSVIQVPLCNIVTPVSNPQCNKDNPTDAAGFGTVLATIPVGINPVMVDALSDGSYAYVANAGNAGANPGVEGSVSVIDLSINRVATTIPAVSAPAESDDPQSSPTLVYGHPNSISVSLASPTGKVYVTSGDNNFLTILRTDTNSVVTHISLQGKGVRVLVTAP